MITFFIQKPIADYYGYSFLAKTSNQRLRFISDFIFDGKKCIKHRTTPKPTITGVMKKFEGIIFSRPSKKQ
jgi:hypothetical protein